MNSVTSYVLNALWIVTFFWAVGWGLSRVVRRAGPWVEHKLWVTILILATIVPAAPIIRASLERRVVTSEETQSNAGLPASIERTRSNIVVPSNAAFLLSGIYLSTVLFFSLRLGWMVRRTVVLVRNATPVSLDGEHQALWEQSTRTFSVQDAVLRRSPNVAGPAAAGFRPPVLLLPSRFIENHSEAEFLAAVGHECAHIQRKDFRKNVFYEAASILIAFHPLAWVIKAQVAQTREMICDAMTAYQLMNRQTYAQALLQLADKMQSVSISPAVGMFDTNTLERRIMTLTTRPNLGWAHVSGLAAFFTLFGCATAGWALAQTVGTPDDFYASLSKLMGREDLACAYYGGGGKASPGTCWLDEKQQELYRCYRNDDLTISQPQLACEYHVQKALKDQANQN